MTIASRELFELCKQVYEATGWGRMDNGSSTDEYYVANPVSIRLNKPDVIKGWQIWRWEDFGESGRLHFSLGRGRAYPIYTSDYLLEKLPPVVQDPHNKIFRHIQMWINGDGSAHAGYVEPYAHDDRVAYAQKSDEMRITLLKLTLKLHEEEIL